MTAPMMRIERWDQLPGVIAKLQVAGAVHSAVLYSALYNGIICYLGTHEGTSARTIKTFCAAARGPQLISIGDDGDLPTGPDGWPQAKRLLKWARRVIVHAGPGRVEEYQDAVIETVLVGRVLLIETGTAHAEAWRVLAVAARPDHSVHVLLPAHGPHPAPIAREKMQ